MVPMPMAPYYGVNALVVYTPLSENLVDVPRNIQAGNAVLD